MQPLNRILCACLLTQACLLIGLHANESVTVKTLDTGEALVNPCMGWTMHFYSNVPTNYGSQLSPADTLDDFPGLSTVYLRLPWAYIEPEEGKYNWAILDTPAQRWIAKGKRIALRLTCSENWMTYATPEWVRNAGAKGTFYEFNKGRAERSNTWDPFFDDPVFLEKLDAFLAAVAKRYDGNPNVEFIDIGSYGMWGEGHTFMSSQQDDLATQKIHIDLHLKHLKKTLLCISDDFAGHDKPGRKFPITDYAVSHGVTLRDDSILVQPPPHSWYHAEIAQEFWPKLPVILERREAETCDSNVVRGVYEGYHKGGCDSAKSLQASDRTKPLCDFGVADEVRCIIGQYEAHGPCRAAYLAIPISQTGSPPAIFKNHPEEVLTLCSKGGEKEVKPPLLLANYYTWYHAGDHPDEPWSHWTYDQSKTNTKALTQQREGQPPPASSAYPLAGFYDSADAEIAGWHVQLAQSCGIDAFLVDWWENHKGLDQAIDNGILKAVEKYQFKFAILDERAQFHSDFAWYREAVSKALEKYMGSPAYLRIDGRPVWYLYQVASDPGLTPENFLELKAYVEKRVGPVYWIVDKIAHDHTATDGVNLAHAKTIPQEWLETAGIDAFGFYSAFSNFREHTYEGLLPTYRHLAQLAHGSGKKMLLPVHPGHDNSNFRDDPYVMPRRDGQTLRDYLRAATDAKADMIMITSWNEWPETTVIEPSSTWSDPYMYLRIIAEWRGKKFEIPPTLVVPGKSK
jgi:hypothetical protein